MSDEMVLCVDRADLAKAIDLSYAGSYTPCSSAIQKAFGEVPYNFRLRRDVEDDASVKQLIPYIVVCHRYEEIKVLTYRRTKRVGETRLAGLSSLGFGGHVNPQDADGDDSSLAPSIYRQGGLLAMMKSGAWRELQEEICGFLPPCLALRGFVNHDVTDVGRVHFGFVYEMTIVDGALSIADSALVDQGFCSVDSLMQIAGQFEDWSRLILRDRPSFLC